MGRKKRATSKLSVEDGHHEWEEPSDILIVDDQQSEWQLEESIRMWEQEERALEDDSID